MIDLTGKTILVAGSSRGIGLATAKSVAFSGGTPVLHGKSESDALREFAEELNAPFISCDVSDRAAVHESVARVLSERGSIDGLVNSAGIVRPKPFLETEEKDWAEAIGINLMGSAWLCQAVIPAMLEKGKGSIVNISSIRGVSHTASARSVPYSASKAAIINMTATLAKEFGPSVRVNCVTPGFIETDISQTWSPAVRQNATTAIAGRTGQPDEIGHVVTFLLSDASSFVTGQTIVADGGYGIAGN